VPKRPDKACRVLGCPYVAPCPVHGRQVTEPLRQAERDRGRLSAHRRGYGHKWRGFAERYFAELWRLKVPRAGQCGCRHPSAPPTDDSVCAREGLIRMATLIDHIIPITGPGDPLLYDKSNLQGLCDTCHNKKRKRESDAAKRRHGRRA
jgi:5-methylcytosine-specific restriction endonuclease McrA